MKTREEKKIIRQRFAHFDLIDSTKYERRKKSNARNGQCEAMVMVTEKCLKKGIKIKT